MKKAIKIIVIVIGVLLVVAIIGGLFIWNTLPQMDENRIELPQGAVGINTGFSYAWLIPTENGVLLVDAGLDKEGEAIQAELNQRGLSAADVHTILLTHGHPDHWGGTAAFPQATIYIHQADAHLFAEEEEGSGLSSFFGDMIMGDVTPPAVYETLNGDPLLEIDGEQFEIYSVPGHSSGSIAILWQDILFLGDSVQKGKSGLELPPEMFSENQEQIKESLSTLLDVDFSIIAVAHSDIIEDGRASLEQFVSEQ